MVRTETCFAGESTGNCFRSGASSAISGSDRRAISKDEAFSRLTSQGTGLWHPVQYQALGLARSSTQLTAHHVLLGCYSWRESIQFRSVLTATRTEQVVDGAGSGVPRLRLATAGSGGTGTARRTLGPGREEHRCTRSGGNDGDGSADPEAQNRHGGAPRGARPRSQGDARRLASASACRARHAGVPRKHPAPSRRSASPRSGGRKACPRESGEGTRRPRASGQRAAKRWLPASAKASAGKPTSPSKRWRRRRAV